MQKPQLLIVDDEERIREGLQLVLEPMGLEVVCAGSAEEGLEALQSHSINIILMDLYLPGMNGIEALERIVRDHPQIPCIMISGQGGIADAVRAVQLGAFDFIEKPVQPNRLAVTIEKALRHHKILNELKAHRDEIRREWQLVGSCPAMKKLKAEISRSAPSTGWVLIEGENGTGKELVARLIHEESARRDQPFIRLNSAALPTELVESELFGHEAGAFTGATKRRKGKLEQAHEGTLFLDEVADMDLAAQAKLLRALGTGEVERVGGSEILHVDVRLVCATNRNLRAEVDAGRFREDLYFRICVIPIAVPALRDRNGDILELAEHFLARCCAENGRPPLQLEADARRVLQEHQWPGNVRELRNLMERLAIMHPTNIVSAEGLYNYLPPAGPSSALGAGTPRGEQAALADEDLGPAPAAGHAAPDADSESSALLKERLEEAEKKIIEDVLQRWGWNVTRAAEELGVDRATLHRRTRRLGVQRPRPDASD